MTFEGGGNVHPILRLGQLLVRRGYHVRVIGSRSIRRRVETTGCEFHALPASTESDPARPIEDQEDWWQQLMCGPAVAEAVVDEIAREPADVLAIDCMLRNALSAAERSGLPTAVLFHARYRFWSDVDDPEVHEWELQPLNLTRKRLGLEPMPRGGRRPMVRLWQRCDRRLALMPREFDQPEDSLTASVVYVGPLFESDDLVEVWDLPWPADGPDPLVVVSFSTTYMRQEGVIRKVVVALEGLGVHALVTLGAGLAPEAIPAPPPWAAIRRYVPHRVVLPHARLLVTHAGLGTVMAGFAHGVPMVCLPLGREQPLNARRVEELGAGRMLSPEASIAEIRIAIADALGSSALRAGARRMADVVRAYGQGAHAVEELELLLPSSAAAPL